MEDFYALKPGAIWAHMKKEHIAFWMVCGYLFFEYVRPQSIFPAIDVLPWARVFLLGAMVFWVIDPNRRWVSDPVNKWMVIFLGVITLSCFTALYPQWSWDNYFNFFGWFIIYFVIINNVTTRKRFFVFLLIFLVASFKLSQHGARTWTLRGFGFTGWGLKGPPGFFENSGELAIQMLIFASISYYFWVSIKPWLGKWMSRLVVLMPITASMTVVGSSSRGGQLGLLAQVYMVFLRGRMSLRNITLAAMILGVGYYLLPEEQKDRFREMGDDRTSEQRLLYWKNGWEMIKDYPVLGVGYFNFIPHYERYYPEDILFFRGAELPHNIFIQIGTDAGFVGLFVYLMLILSAFKTTRAIRKMAPDDTFAVNMSKGFDAAFWGFLIAGQFVTVGYYPFMWIHLALVVCLKSVVAHSAGHDARKVVR